jgi:hypothetical protein
MLLIVIPTLNEEKNVKFLFKLKIINLLTYYPLYEIANNLSNLTIWKKGYLQLSILILASTMQYSLKYKKIH